VRIAAISVLAAVAGALLGMGVVGGLGVVVGYALYAYDDPVPTLPEAVEETRAALLAAAEDGDYEALRELIPADGFEYTFGGPVPGGAVAYWQELERTTEARPLATLADVLRQPYVLSRGIYVWPWAYTVESRSDLTPYERALLAPLGPLDTLFPAPDSGYFGWRTGIEPDGTWSFFVAGD
jgi:hypothetical protein